MLRAYNFIMTCPIPHARDQDAVQCIGGRTCHLKSMAFRCCRGGADGDAAIALVQAATASGVDQYVMVTSLGAGKFGLPAGAAHRPALTLPYPTQQLPGPRPEQCDAGPASCPSGYSSVGSVEVLAWLCCERRL